MSDATKKTRKKAVTPAQAAKIEGAFDAAMAAKRAQTRSKPQEATQVSTKPLVTQEGLETELAAIAQDVAKKKTGRPTKWTQEIEDEICARLSRGEPLRAICRTEGFPEWVTVYNWMERSEALSLRVARAREHGVEAIAQDTLAMIDAPPQVVVDNNGVSRIDPAYVQWTKLRTEQRMKLLACWSPNRYGNRVQVAGDKENPLQVNIQATEMFDSILKNAEMTRQIDVE